MFFPLFLALQCALNGYFRQELYIESDL